MRGCHEDWDVLGTLELNTQTMPLPLVMMTSMATP